MAKNHNKRSRRRKNGRWLLAIWWVVTFLNGAVLFGSVNSIFINQMKVSIWIYATTFATLIVASTLIVWRRYTTNESLAFGSRR